MQLFDYILIATITPHIYKKIGSTIVEPILPVGVRRFELPTTRPPDAYSNLAELHPGLP